MANTSELFGGERDPSTSLQSHYASAASASAGVKLASLGLITAVSLLGNVGLSLLLLRDRSLHRAPYFFLLDLCAADAVRSAVCFPIVMASIVRGSAAWTHDDPVTCRISAFLSVLLCFHVAFLLLCVSVTRYLAVAHHHFYAQRVCAPCACAAVICASWALSAAVALPPVFDVMGTYGFIRGEEQCAFEHRANDTLGFMLMLLVATVAATHLVYAKTLHFVYGHRKMKPAQLVPAVSHNWTFHGPGATGQAAANWIAGFGRGPTPPTLVGIRQSSSSSHHPGNNRMRLLVLDEFKSEKRIGKMYYAITVAFLVLWAPYMVVCYLRIFVRGGAAPVPQLYLTAAVWMSFAQAGANPVVSLLVNKELRTRLRVGFRCRLGSRTPVEPYCVI